MVVWMLNPLRQLSIRVYRSESSVPILTAITLGLLAWGMFGYGTWRLASGTLDVALGRRSLQVHDWWIFAVGAAPPCAPERRFHPDGLLGSGRERGHDERTRYSRGRRASLKLDEDVA